MELRKFIKTIIREYLNESINRRIVGDKTIATLTNKKESRLGTDYYFTIENDKNEKIGYIEITDREFGHKPIPYYQIGNVELIKQNMGYGTSLYISLINSLDKPLVSDPSLSDLAKLLWNSLLNKGYAKIWVDDMNRERFMSIKK